jgi:hypothetical protein
LLNVFEEQIDATKEDNNDLDVLVKKKFKLDF